MNTKAVKEKTPFMTTIKPFTIFSILLFSLYFLTPSVAKASCNSLTNQHPLIDEFLKKISANTVSSANYNMQVVRVNSKGERVYTKLNKGKLYIRKNQVRLTSPGQIHVYNKSKWCQISLETDESFSKISDVRKHYYSLNFLMTDLNEYKYKYNGVKFENNVKYESVTLTPVKITPQTAFRKIDFLIDPVTKFPQIIRFSEQTSNIVIIEMKFAKFQQTTMDLEKIFSCNANSLK